VREPGDDAVSQVEQYPAYLDALEVGDERSIRRRIDDLQTELQTLATALEDARRGKRILYLTGSDLEREVVRFLQDELGLNPRVSNEGAGFWLADAKGEDWGIGSVHSSEAGNVSKEHLADLMIRRLRAGKDEGAPALLIVNTYQSGRTIEERDQAVPPEISRRAAEDHILVMRTLDLLRLQQRAANGFPGGEQVTDALRGRGGWFDVDVSLNARVHGGDPQMAAAEAR
jgi:hypothetical protein